MYGSPALKERPPEGDDETASLLRQGEDTLLAGGSLGEAREWFDAAYVAAEARGDGTGMARAALGMNGMWAQERRPSAEAEKVRARQREALSRLDPRSPLGRRLCLRLVAEQDYLTGGHEATLALVEEAMRGDDPVAVAEALGGALHCVMGPAHTALRLDLARELLAAASRTGRRHDLLMGLMWCTVALFQSGDPYAGRRLEELRTQLAQGDHLAIGYVPKALEVMLGIRDGRFAAAEEQAAACADRGKAAGFPFPVGPYWAQLGTIRWYQGRIGELVPSLSELMNAPQLNPADDSAFPSLALAAATAGDRRLATSALAKVCGPGLARLPHSGTWSLSMYLIVEAAHLLGDTEIAAQAYDLLLPYAHLPVVVSLGFACLGSAHHTLGVAALTTGQADTAVTHLRQAVRDNLALGHWPAVTLSRARLGQALALRDGPGSEEALRELTLAVQEATQLGMTLPSGISATAAPATDSKVTCGRSGSRWRIEFGGRTALVDDRVGMRHLATLLANPYREIRAIDLASGPEPADERGGPAQPLLDDEARRQYKERLTRLDADIEELDARHDLERANALRAERDWLIAEITAAAGLGGRLRHFRDDEERARVAVGKAIRRALDRIAAADPIIGAVLRATVHTGARCSYQPA